jgi:hypothetical protein
VGTTGSDPCESLEPSGSITVTEPGTVVENKCVTGRVVVKSGATGVKISNVYVDGRNKYTVHVEGGASADISDVTVDGNTSQDPSWAGIAVFFKGSGSLVRADVRDMSDGIRIESSNVTIADSWVHGLTRVPGGHHDTLQIRDAPRGVVIERNRLEAYNPVAQDPMNAAIQMGSPVAANRNTDPQYQIRGLVIRGNYLDGGSYTMRAGGSEGWVQDACWKDNVFGPHRTFGDIQAMDRNAWHDNC